MEREPTLPTGALIFLGIIGGIADVLKIALDFFFGIGVFLDPFLITPPTLLIYWITFQHCNVPMFTGRRAKAAWINLVVGLVPVLDAIPDFSAYNLYLFFSTRVKQLMQPEHETADQAA